MADKKPPLPIVYFNECTVEPDPERGDAPIEYGSLKVFTPADLDGIPPRPKRGQEPVDYAGGDKVPVTGDKLSPVIWRGRQWAVTEYGLECLDGTYAIKADRLAENVKDYPWTTHVTLKDWVDSDDFTTAWLIALAVHGVRVGKADVRNAIRRSAPPSPNK